jgi:hypothetical protein
LERAEQSTLWITASEVGASATCVGVAPACKELRSGPNKSEREPTSARSTNYGSGHLIPAFHGTGRTFSLLPSHPLDAASRSIDAPLVSCLRGKVPRPKMVSSNQKRFQLCFVRNSPQNFLTERRAVGFLRHLANVFARSHCWAILLFGCRNQNTWGRAHGRRGNSIDCDSDFVAGFVLDRLAMRRRRFDAEKSKTKL